MVWKIAEVDIFGERIRYRLTNSEDVEIGATGYDDDGDMNIDEVLFHPSSRSQSPAQLPELACLALQRAVRYFHEEKLESILDGGSGELARRGVLQDFIGPSLGFIFIEVPPSTPLDKSPFQLMCDPQSGEPISLTLLANNEFPLIDIIGAPSFLGRFKPLCLKDLKLPKE